MESSGSQGSTFAETEDKKKFKPLKAFRRMFRDGKKNAKRPKTIFKESFFTDEDPTTLPGRLDRRVSMSHDSIFRAEPMILTAPALETKPFMMSQGDIVGVQPILPSFKDELALKLDPSQLINKTASPGKNLSPDVTQYRSLTSMDTSLNEKPIAPRELDEDKEMESKDDATSVELKHGAALDKIAVRPRNRKPGRRRNRETVVSDVFSLLVDDDAADGSRVETENVLLLTEEKNEDEKESISTEMEDLQLESKKSKIILSQRPESLLLPMTDVTKVKLRKISADDPSKSPVLLEAVDNSNTKKRSLLPPQQLDTVGEVNNKKIPDKPQQSPKQSKKASGDSKPLTKEKKPRWSQSRSKSLSFDNALSESPSKTDQASNSFKEESTTKSPSNKEQKTSGEKENASKQTNLFKAALKKTHFNDKAKKGKEGSGMSATKAEKEKTSPASPRSPKGKLAAETQNTESSSVKPRWLHLKHQTKTEKTKSSTPTEERMGSKKDEDVSDKVRGENVFKKLKKRNQSVSDTQSKPDKEQKKSKEVLLIKTEKQNEQDSAGKEASKRVQTNKVEEKKESKFPTSFLDVKLRKTDANKKTPSAATNEKNEKLRKETDRSVKDKPAIVKPQSSRNRNAGRNTNNNNANTSLGVLKPGVNSNRYSDCFDSRTTIPTDSASPGTKPNITRSASAKATSKPLPPAQGLDEQSNEASDAPSWVSLARSRSKKWESGRLVPAASMSIEESDASTEEQSTTPVQTDKPLGATPPKDGSVLLRSRQSKSLEEAPVRVSQQVGALFNHGDSPTWLAVAAQKQKRWSCGEAV